MRLDSEVNIIALHWSRSLHIHVCLLNRINDIFFNRFGEEEEQVLLPVYEASEGP